MSIFVSRGVQVHLQILHVFAYRNRTYLFLAHGQTQQRLQEERHVLEEKLAVGGDVRHLASHYQSHLVTQVNKYRGLYER